MGGKAVVVGWCGFEDQVYAHTVLGVSYARPCLLSLLHLSRVTLSQSRGNEI